MTLDLDLKPEDIQSLGNRDALVAFFTGLRYNTEARIKQSAANLGIGTESVVREIKYIEQIASQEGARNLHVFLFEVRSVTVALTNALARTFRNKAGEYLLVITHDYEQLDFVLVERSIPIAESNSSIGEKQVLVRPRVLTIERRKPTRKQLRVLRRFTYTETDPLFQFEKLKSAYSIYDWSEDHFNNRILFADYYLQERLRDQPEWKEDVKPLYLKVREIMSEAAHVWQDKNESDLRVGLYEKLFTILGFTYRREKESKDDSPIPDYFLFGKSGENPIAVCLCYPWGRSLDGKDDQRDQDTPEENPSAAVVSILKDGKPLWAIVTNGKLWRLYNAKTPSVAASFYEIDLEEILATPTQLASPSTFDLSDSFKYFSLFFRQEAFEPRNEMVAGEEKTTTFLDSLQKGSEEYAKRLGERLKDRVFDEVFIHFADGFIEFIKKRDGKDADVSQEKLDEVFQGTLTLLYRLLFMLYSESRDLFPVKEIRGYYEKSLTRLKLEIAEAGGPIAAEVEEKLKAKHTVSGTILYDRLLELFRIVDQGDPSINVPMYNGGLFVSKPAADDQSEDALLARFLLQTKVPDRYLANGLDLLARDEDDKTFKQVAIDYKSLGVRQLGSIYEGLLEFKLRVAREKMAAIRGKKTEEVVPYDEAVEKKLKIIAERKGGAITERIIPKGKLYLENDKRERKATGSYYTPDYIVKYIVENTVGPVLKEKFERIAPEFRKSQAWHKEMLKRKEARQSQKLKILLPLKEQEGEEDLTRFNTLVHDLFDVKVLDPAMGSGHFLVDAADFVSDRLIGFLNGFPWNPVNKMLDDTRKTILAEMEKQGVAIDAGRLTDVNLIKRHVLKRCIYGVDLNPMAVELAKVSLWLNCFTLGAPLSFLDHHLKCGNSLIGAGIDEVKNELEKDLFGGQFAGLMRATEGMIHVGELSDVTAEQVKESQRSFLNASHILEPFKEVLDLWVSQYFGNEDALQLFRTSQFPQIGARWEEEVAKLRVSRAIESGAGKKKTGTRTERIDVATLLNNAHTSVSAKRFFHWELEFPEVFYDKGKKKDEPGFDSVIGNPPYVGFHGMEGDKPFLEQKFESCRGKFDIYLAFIESAMRLVRERFSLSYICPSTFMKREFASEFRSLLVSSWTLKELVDFGSEQLFEGATNYTCILVLQNTRTSGEYDFRYSKATGQGTAHSLSSLLLKPQGWILAEPDKGRALQKILNGKALIHLQGIAETISEGVVTAMNDVFVVDEDTIREHDLEWGYLKRRLSGEHLHRYEVDWENDYLIYPYVNESGETVCATEEKLMQEAPNLWRYLLSNREKLKGRSYFESSSKEWFELWNQRSFSLLEASKIVVPEIESGNNFALAGHDYFYGDTVCGIKLGSKSQYDDRYVLSLLNSRTLTFAMRSISVPKANNYLIYKPMYLRQLPIRRINFSTPSKDRERLLDDARRLYQEFLVDHNQIHVTEFVSQLLPINKDDAFVAFENSATGTEEKSDVAHDFLAFLANEMIRLSESKHAEMRHLGDWIGKELRVKGRSVNGYLDGVLKCHDMSGPSFDIVMEALGKNTAKLGVSLNSASLVSKIRMEFERVVEFLRPVKQRLLLTDRLIDRIVFLLYGLSSDEITIIEKEFPNDVV